MFLHQENMMENKRKFDVRAVLVAIFLLYCRGTAASKIEGCDAPLGMTSGDIADHQISSSSHYDAAVQATFARAHKESGGGAWCPKQMVYNQGSDYLEIDLLRDHIITKSEVQGRFANGQGREYAEQYKLQYWRESIDTWITYKNGQGIELLDGNTNTYLPASTTLTPSFVASRVRFIPYSHHSRTVCMRVEIYGCPNIDGLVSYSMTDGEMRGSDGAMRDQSYDGERRGDKLFGGLGQLTDGETGHSNFRIDAKGQDKGYEWIGWKNDSRGSLPVEIEFNFNSVRNFSAVHIYTNNLFSKDAQIFSKVRIFFSIGGTFFSQNVTLQTLPDKINEEAKNITISLKNLPAIKVKIELYFSNRWILISEVAFDSVPCSCILPVETSAGLPPIENSYVEIAPASSDNSEILIGCLTALGILFGLILIMCLILHYKKNFFRSIKSSSQYTNNNKRKASMDMNDLHINYNASSHSQQRPKCKFYGDINGDEESSTLYQEPYRGPLNNPGYYTLAPTATLGDLAHDPMLPNRDSSDYAIPAMSETNNFSHLDVYRIPSPIPTLNSQLENSQRAELNSSTGSTAISGSDEVNSPAIVDIRGVIGSALLPISNSQINFENNQPIVEIKRDQIKILDLIGESSFGYVHICALENSLSRRSEKVTKLHIIKTLKQSASPTNKSDFRNELTIQSNLSDLNISGLIGMVSNDPVSAIFEYTDYGDLYQFLRFHDCESQTNQSTLSSFNSDQAPTLSYGALLYISTQIASGMKYLESRNIVHRDLAARNCLIGKKLGVKLSDFAVTRTVYIKDYWNIEGRLRLPIRWMPPESILHARFTSKSDVWSFGVTLWEILTLAKERPLDHLGDSAVVERICRSSPSDDAEPYLPQPHQTCKEVYQIMTSCWRPTEKQRPPFWEILLFLQRKNLGYNIDYIEQ